MQPQFIASEYGPLFVLLHRPQQTCRGILLYAHAFAEEMNKARRASAVAARRLAEEGWAVVQIDLYGCGDSAGDFGDARWSIWLDNLIVAASWARAQIGDVPLWLWGTRAGCLLTAQIAHRVQACGLLWWQPVCSGRQFLTQFLRLKMAGELITEGNTDKSSGDTKALRSLLLEQNQAVEIAGYILAPELAAGLEHAELKLHERCDIVWLEGSLRDEPALAPASQKCITELQTLGCRLNAQAIKFEPFWQSLEIAEVPELVEATREVMRVQI